MLVMFNFYSDSIGKIVFSWSAELFCPYALGWCHPYHLLLFSKSVDNFLQVDAYHLCLFGKGTSMHCSCCYLHEKTSTIKIFRVFQTQVICTSLVTGHAWSYNLSKDRTLICVLLYSNCHLPMSQDFPLKKGTVLPVSFPNKENFLNWWSGCVVQKLFITFMEAELSFWGCRKTN